MTSDRYEIVGSIGRGGMAEVFLAIAHGALGFQRRVAIKRMRPELADDWKTSRAFLDEARIASRLHHAGIVSVLDFGTAEGRPFQVLEHVDGWSVAALLRHAAARGHRMPVEVALVIVTEVAHALSHAHEACGADGRPLGVVHRDVKPSNVLVSRSGDVKLADFGIAYAAERSLTTTENVVKGTRGYMAPEQLLGAPLDGRTDVFALGCLLHALFVGKSPCDGLAPSEILRLDELPLGELPVDVQAIVRQAVRPRIEDRPSAREVAALLGEALAARLETDAKSCLVGWLERAGLEPVAVLPVEPFIFRTQSGLEAETKPEAPTTVPKKQARPVVTRRTIFLAGLAVPTILTAAVLTGVVLGRQRAPSSPPVVDGGPLKTEPSVTSSAPAPAPSELLAENLTPMPKPSAERVPRSAERACECVYVVGGVEREVLCPRALPPRDCRCVSLEFGGLCADAACTRTEAAPGPQGSSCTGYRDGKPNAGTLECRFCYGPPIRSPGVHGAPCRGVGNTADAQGFATYDGRLRCH